MGNLRYAVKVLSEVQTGFGYVIRKEIWPGFGFDVAPMGGAGGEVDEIVTALEGIAEKARHPAEMETCYTTDGDWIGDPDTAKYLCEDRGIYPVHADEIPKGALIPCSVGFCERDQKWYGWSHRAKFGFGIGDIVKQGDCCASSGYTEEYLKDHPDENSALPIGFVAKTLDDCKAMAKAFACSVNSLN